MLIPHLPCTDCKHKDKCSKCAFTMVQTNYMRALEEIKTLKDRLGESVIILK